MSGPIGILLGGILADRFFEPLMMAPTGAAQLFVPLVGSGPGAGMGLMMVLSGLIGASVGVVGYLVPVIRNAETILPDHTGLEAPASLAPEAAAAG